MINFSLTPPPLPPAASSCRGLLLVSLSFRLHSLILGGIVYKKRVKVNGIGEDVTTDGIPPQVNLIMVYRVSPSHCQFCISHVSVHANIHT